MKKFTPEVHKRLARDPEGDAIAVQHQDGAAHYLFTDGSIDMQSLITEKSRNYVLVGGIATEVCVCTNTPEEVPALQEDQVS